jgi:hypothetical protein
MLQDESQSASLRITAVKGRSRAGGTGGLISKLPDYQITRPVPACRGLPNCRIATQVANAHGAWALRVFENQRGLPRIGPTVNVLPKEPAEELKFLRNSS